MPKFKARADGLPELEGHFKRFLDYLLSLGISKNTVDEVMKLLPSLSMTASDISQLCRRVDAEMIEAIKKAFTSLLAGADSIDSFIKNADALITQASSLGQGWYDTARAFTGSEDFQQYLTWAVAAGTALSVATVLVPIGLTVIKTAHAWGERTNQTRAIESIIHELRAVTINQSKQIELSISHLRQTSGTNLMLYKLINSLRISLDVDASAVEKVIDEARNIVVHTSPIDPFHLTSIQNEAQKLALGILSNLHNNPNPRKVTGKDGNDFFDGLTDEYPFSLVITCAFTGVNRKDLVFSLEKRSYRLIHEKFENMGEFVQAASEDFFALFKKLYYLVVTEHQKNIERYHAFILLIPHLARARDGNTFVSEFCRETVSFEKVKFVNLYKFCIELYRNKSEEIRAKFISSQGQLSDVELILNRCFLEACRRIGEYSRSWIPDPLGGIFKMRSDFTSGDDSVARKLLGVMMGSHSIGEKECEMIYQDLQRFCLSVITGRVAQPEQPPSQEANAFNDHPVSGGIRIDRALKNRQVSEDYASAKAHFSMRNAVEALRYFGLAKTGYKALIRTQDADNIEKAQRRLDKIDRKIAEIPGFSSAPRI